LALYAVDKFSNLRREKQEAEQKKQLLLFAESTAKRQFTSEAGGGGEGKEKGKEEEGCAPSSSLDPAVFFFNRIRCPSIAAVAVFSTENRKSKNAPPQVHTPCEATTIQSAK
jgi:hypothetical protein